MKNVYTVSVIQTVEVELDPEKFTPEFMEEFNKTITQMDLRDHARHLAQLTARGIIDEVFTERTEGYGKLEDMGIKTKVEDVEIELLHAAEEMA